MKFPRFIQDFLAMFFYLLFGAVEIIVIFGVLLGCVFVPYFISEIIETKTGNNYFTYAMVIGISLMALWYWFLDSGGRKKIELYFRSLTHKAIRKAGASDAIYDD